ncbi:MAG: hypothetical protein LBL72_03430 [Candidatus Accumulibacter sp.]|jgi:hypothetical protein|nr:hypothetical protein [Accumulibacter sp.]
MPSIAEYLKYANLQMAAEALFGFDANITPNMTPGERLDIGSWPMAIDSAWLTTGNRRASLLL